MRAPTDATRKQQENSVVWNPRTAGKAPRAMLWGNPDSYQARIQSQHSPAGRQKAQASLLYRGGRGQTDLQAALGGISETSKQPEG